MMTSVTKVHLHPMVPTKYNYFLWLSGLLLLLWLLVGYFDDDTAGDNNSQDNSSFLNNNPLDNDRRPENRTPLREDEFWLVQSDQAYLPFDIDFIPPDDKSPYGKLEPMWSCKDRNATTLGRPKKLIFVHVVRTEAYAIQDLISSYASLCHAGIASTVVCSGLSWESMISGTWTNRKVAGTNSGSRCRLLAGSKDRNGKAFKGTKYITTPLLAESIDTLVGQIPLGSHEQWKGIINYNTDMDPLQEQELVDAQYVVSLRAPYDWFVSSMITKVIKSLKEENDGSSVLSSSSSSLLLDKVIDAIKEKVETDLALDLYHEVYARYLITPSQISWVQKEAADLGIEHRVSLSLRNLMDSNAVFVFTEKMTESLEILQFLLDAEGKQDGIFAQAREKLLEQQKSDENESGTSSSRSVKTVLKALKRDSEFYEEKFKEYLKYEVQIYDHAKDMHKRQLAWLHKNRPTRIE